MAAELNTDVPARAESQTLRALEERLREHLAERLGIRTRFTRLPGTRALLVSPMRPEGAKGLVIDSTTTAAERVYLYLHVSAHVALRHNVPLMTIVEPLGEPFPSDASTHRDAEQLTRAAWWGGSSAAEMPGTLPASRSYVLRALLRTRFSRFALRRLLLSMRALYYGIRGRRAFDSLGVTSVLRDALCVTAVVCAAPQLAEGRRSS